MTETYSQRVFRLLVIDDNEAIHDDMKKILVPSAGEQALLADEMQLFGRRNKQETVFQIDSAFQGHLGLEMLLKAKAEDAPYALAFVDVRMPPGWDGIETIGHLWEADPNLQVVICTAYSDYNWGDVSERLGISQNLVILKKPFDPIEVIQLAHALTAKWQSSLRVQSRMRELDREVEDRTARLRQTVAELIAARDRAEEAAQSLKQNQALLNAAEELSRSGAWRWAEISGRIELSAGAQRILGVPQPSVTPLDLMKCVHPDDVASMEADLFEARKSTTSSITVEHRILTRDTGEERTIVANGKIVRDEDGRIACAAGALQDVTETRRVETQFRQSQRMEAVGRLASGVAHDFNNLLSVMMGQAELLRDDSAPGSAPYQRANEILDTVERATKMTRQLLDIGRQQASQRTPVDLHHILLASEGMLRRLLGERIALGHSLQANRHVVYASADQLSQVILNLAVNARDAMPKGGSLILSTADADSDDPVAARLDHSCVVLTVTDEGVGMDDQVLAKIFDPFFTTKPRGKGTGLGLSTVYGIINNHGGAIEVKSKPGFGSTFMIYLPSVDTPALTVQPEPVLTAESGSGTILLTEDEEGLRALLRKFLESGGYNVIEAANPRSAVTCLKEAGSGIDMLLTDVVMPGMSGQELARELKLHHPGLKTLFISGYAGNMLAQFDFVSEQASFLQKPFSRGTLLNKVKEVLQT